MSDNNVNDDEWEVVIIPIHEWVIPNAPGLNVREIEENSRTSIYNRISNGDNCYVCFGEFQISQEIRQQKCNHEFHKRCIDIWLAMRIYCPFCRENLIN